MVQLLLDVPSKTTLSASVGAVSSLQLAGVDQFVSPPPPPSHVRVAASAGLTMHIYANIYRKQT